MITFRFPKEADVLRVAFCNALTNAEIEFNVGQYGKVFEHQGPQPGVQGTKVTVKEAAVAVAVFCASITPMVKDYFATLPNRSITIEMTDEPIIKITGSTDLEHARRLVQQLQQAPAREQTSRHADPENTKNQ